MTVLAATAWATNADLIAACHQLNYLLDTDLILDPTYGRGIWWKKWRPAHLVHHDWEPDGIDFRDLPYPDSMFDAVAYDPPYVSVGGRKTTTLPDFHNRFGMGKAPTSPRELQELINAGLFEIRRVVKPRGIVLVKCQDYVSSGKLWIGTHHTLAFALDNGYECVDRLEHIGHARPQPKRTRKDGRPVVQQHARRNLSTMFVLRKKKDV